MATDGPDDVEQDLLPVDAVAREALAVLALEPGVHRAGLALTEGGGRRLRFTASDRDGVVVEWCHIDAYDDVPLTLVVRTGEPVAGAVADLAALFPAYVARQSDAPTTALAAVPMLTHGQVLGGVIVLLDRDDALDDGLLDRLTDRASTVAEALRHAQLRSPREGPALADEPVADGVRVAACEVAGDPRAVSAARRFVSAALTAWEVDDDLVDTAVLCLSEVVTNAVIHTGAPSELRATLDDEVLTVTVRDQGSHRGERPDHGAEQQAEGDPLRVHGRGLQLVEALAARWGSELDEVGTTVWFVLEAPRLTP